MVRRRQKKQRKVPYSGPRSVEDLKALKAGKGPLAAPAAPVRPGVRTDAMKEAQQARQRANLGSTRERRDRGLAWRAHNEAETARQKLHPRSPAVALPANPVALPKTGMRFGGTKTKVGAGLVATSALGGGGYALHRRHQERQKEMASKSLIDPYSQIVVFGKAYDVSFFPQSSTRVRALVPTGAHVGHGRALHHTHNSKASSRTNELRRYSGSGKGLRQGPFSKADERKASPGRMAAGTVWPGIHGIAAGRKGRRARAAGNELGGSALGSAPGAAAVAGGAGMVAHDFRSHMPHGGSALVTGQGDHITGITRRGKVAAGLLAGGAAASQVGHLVGANRGTARAQRKGHYNSELNSNNPSGPRKGTRL